MPREDQNTAGGVSALFQAVFEKIPDPTWIFDDMQHYVAVNEAACELHGLPKQDLLKHTSTDFVAPGTEAAAAQAWQTFVKGGRFQGEFYLQQVEGMIRPVELSLIANLLPGYHLATARDLTPQRQAEVDGARQRTRLAALREVDRVRSASRDLHTILDVILTQITTLLGVNAATALVMDKAGLLTLISGIGFRGDRPTPIRLSARAGYAGRAVREGQIIHIPYLSVGGDLLRAPMIAREGFMAGYVVPMWASGQVQGVIELFHRAALDLPPDDLDFLLTLADQAAIAIDNATLFADLQSSNRDLAQSYDQTLEGWSRALDMRDHETEGHTQRVTEWTVRLAERLGLKATDIVHIRRGALLHDIGKMGIPDSILLKPGPLTPEEMTIMRRHPAYAYELLSPIAYLQPALPIPYSHHERWDGTGYPRRLSSNEIPWPARIFAVVDVWDAMRSERPYHAARPEGEVRAHIRSLSGTHFDPQVLAAFLELLDRHIPL